MAPLLLLVIGFMSTTYSPSMLSDAELYFVCVDSDHHHRKRDAFALDFVGGGHVSQRDLL